MASNSISRDRVTVDPQGNWKAFVAIPQRYQEPKGTVKVGTDREGALFFDKQLGEYVMVDRHGRTLQLNQRKVRAALGEREPTAGQPQKGYERREVYSARLEPSIAEYLREFGGDNLSEGIMKMARAHMNRRKESTITFPARDPVYTASRTVRFIGLRGDQVLECSISGEALRDRFGASSMKIEDLLNSYNANKEAIQGVARQKLGDSAEDSCLLTTADFDSGVITYEGDEP